MLPSPDTLSAAASGTTRAIANVHGFYPGHSSVTDGENQKHFSGAFEHLEAPNQRISFGRTS